MTVRYVAVLAVAVSLGLTGAAATSSVAASDQAATASVGAGDGLRQARTAICAIVGTATVGDAAKRLIKENARGQWGALLADVVVATVTTHCSTLVDKATATVQALYRLMTTPSQPSRNAYLATFAAQTETAIANQLRINGRVPSGVYVAQSVDALCADMRAFRSPIATLERYYPKAKLSVLGAMNGVTSLVIQQCPLSSVQAAFMTSAILGHLIDNQFNVDRDPPIVVITAPTETRYTNGTARVQSHYLDFDFSSGVDTCFIWIDYGGAWHPDGAGFADLAQGTVFRFAVRCRDRAGNMSAWAIGSTFTA